MSDPESGIVDEGRSSYPTMLRTRQRHLVITGGHVGITNMNSGTKIREFIRGNPSLQSNLASSWQGRSKYSKPRMKVKKGSPCTLSSLLNLPYVTLTMLSKVCQAHL